MVRWNRMMPGITLVACALILIGMVRLDRFQFDEFDELLWLVRDFRLARVDVTSGFLHHAWATEAADAATATRQAGELDQALQRLDRSVDVPGTEPAEAVASVKRQVQDFRRLLSPDSGATFGGSSAAALQQVFQTLETDMAAIDAGNAKRLRALQARQKREFDLALLLALGLLAVVGWGVLRNSRRLRTAEDALVRHREHLEELVEERTAALTQALAQLKDAEEFTRLVADNIPGRIVYWDSELRCRFVNRSFGTWFGHMSDEIIGRTALELRGAEYFASVKDRLYGALAGEEQDFEREEVSISGERAVSRVQYLPDRRGGKVQGFFVLVTNITRLKQAEQLLRLSNDQLADARDRADEANRAKSTFLANMSHEIRTPMNAIIGLTHMLRRDAQDPVHRERLGKIWDAAHHLLQVINDILDISKIEAGRLVLENIDFSLDALLTRTCSMVLDPARDKGLELVLDTGQLPDRLHGDPTRLMQALLNLLSNAVKFTEQGSIVVKAELLGRDAGNLHIRFEVRDTGPGIRADMLPHLFQPFSQGDSSSTRRHGGTGLGLTITRHIAELMGGAAGADSVVGKGSRFWFSVRLAPAVLQDVASAPVLRGLRALLADDLQDAREALADMLQTLGLRVDTAPTGAEALRLAEAAAAAGDPYAVALLDWVMPGMDGIETAQLLRMRVDPPPALALVSARDPEAVRRLAHEVGIGGILMKPITPSMLLDCLMRLLQRAVRPVEPAMTGPAPLEEVSSGEEALRIRHRGARVLLAEDNPVNQEVAAELLQAAGLVVDIAGDGEQAVRMARRNRYALILMDMQMPRMDGLQATRQLREDPAFAQTPIIAMTANAFTEDRQTCLDAGMNDHLAKPVDPRVLHACLLRWLPEAGPRLQPGASEPVAKPVDPEARFAGIEGLDLQIAYQYCAGKTELLARVLQQFVAHSRHVGAAIVDNLEAGNVDDPRRMLHSLRGSSASIGATQVLALVVPLEVGIKTGTPPGELLAGARALQSELVRLVDAIAQRLD
jgi:PAS domain S-box-containing protein